MSSHGTAQSKNAARSSNKLPAKLTPNSSSSEQKFSAAGQPAGITSSSKMLGDNRCYNPNPSETTTDPFVSLPRFPDKHRTMDGDERSSITSASDNDDTVPVNEDGKLKPAPGKKTRGRVKIQMEYIQNKLRRYTTFSKRKSGIMKKAYELSTLTGTQVMLLVASETGHVYTFATPKLQPMITSEAGKALIQTCLHQPDPPISVVNNPVSGGDYDVRMSSTGYEETELGYNNLPEEDFKGGLVDMHPLSTSAQMPAVLGGPIVTIPHMMHYTSSSSVVPVCESQPMPSQSLMAPLHQMASMQPMTTSHQILTSHPSPPPTYSPPHRQPTSPQRTYTPTSYPGSPPSATAYSQAHQQVMMHEELGSPMGHHGIDNYDRSPSRSPIRYSSPHHVHSPPQAVYSAVHSPPQAVYSAVHSPPQAVYSAPHGSPPMAGHHSPIMRI